MRKRTGKGKRPNLRRFVSKDVERDRNDRVGFYGCSVVDRVVRVSLDPEADRYPRSSVVDCPCGNRHVVAIAWRKLVEGEWFEAEFEVAPKER